MATDLIQPGEIITSRFMNDVLASIDELKNRIERLETVGPAGSEVSIRAFDPPTQVEVGRPLTIIGGNFDSITANNRITVADRPVTQFRVGSTSTELHFIVPDVEGVPIGGKNVTIRVANDKGTVERLYRVLPKIPVIGPPPAITGVTRLANGSTQLRVNDVAVIAGHDFDSTPANNRIRFTVVPTRRVYPDPATGLPAIVIDTVNSNPNSIRVTVPDIEEVIAGADPMFIDLEVEVGAHVAAVIRVPVIRP